MVSKTEDEEKQERIIVLADLMELSKMIDEAIELGGGEISSHHIWPGQPLYVYLAWKRPGAYKIRVMPDDGEDDEDEARTRTRPRLRSRLRTRLQPKV